MALDLEFYRAAGSTTPPNGNQPVTASEDDPLPVRPLGAGAELPAVVDLGGGSFRDRSGTIAAASVAQDVMAANSARRYLFVQIPSAGSKCWLDYGVPAVGASPSIELPAGASVELQGYVCTQKVSIFCATAAAAFTAKEG